MPHVSVIKKGTLLAEGSVADLIKGETQIEIAAENNEQLLQTLQSFTGIKKAMAENNIVILNVDETFNAAQLNKYLSEKNIYLKHLNARKNALKNNF